MAGSRPGMTAGEISGAGPRELRLTAEQQEVRALARDFAEREIAPSPRI